jgi:DNA repair photolyase
MYISSLYDALMEVCSPMRHGSNLDPPNRFEKFHVEVDWEHLEWDREYQEGLNNRAIEYIEDLSQGIVSTNNSPDLSFRFSVNPYRGCIHACAYCYARPYHEYLGFNAGLDFETKIVVKLRAAELLREFLSKDSWKPELIVFSGVTDCYQPAERRFRLTRGCLEVVRDCQQPVSIITKNALVLRDLDILRLMAERKQVTVNISITTLDAELARAMEPRTSIPSARLRAVSVLAEAGVPVRVMVAPIIPGLNDHEVPEIMRQAKNAGAMDAAYTLLRLPLTVAPVFEEWLRRTQPLKAGKVESHIRSTRNGKWSNSTFGIRHRGTGQTAEQIRNMFNLFYQQFQFSRPPKLDFSQFKPPTPRSGQLRLF